MNEQIKKRIEQILRGEVPEGYKKTGAGIIPNSWNITTLDLLMGNIESGTSVNSDTSKDSGMYILKTSAIQQGKVSLNESKAVVKTEFSRLKCPVKEGCILVSRMNTPLLVGACGYVFQSSKLHFLPDRLWQAHNSDPDHCSFVYLNYLLNSARYKRAVQNLATGTSNSMKNISKESYLGVVLSLPHLPWQQKIAAILTTQDKVIELKEKLLVEKQRQKKYLCQQLLTGKKRLPGFSGDWKSEHLGKLFAERVETKREDLPLLAITGTQGIIPRSELDLKDNSSEDKSKYLRICVGDIGYNTMRMWQGVSAYSNHEGIVSPAYTILKPVDSINAKYFAYLFKMPEVVFLFYRFSQGLVDDTRNLKYDNFRRINVNYPMDKREQDAIVEHLSIADQEISLLKKSIDAEKQKKKALMQLLLSGIVRVKV